MKVSLIMPSYERALRTERAIQCIINQDMQDFEAYVIGDNCPVIQSFVELGKAAAYIKEAKDKGIKLSIFNLPHHYAGYGYQARNTGIKLAQGKYTMFLDNDDIIENNHISNYYNAISDTDYDFMYFNSWIDPIENRGERGRLRETSLERGMVGHAEIIAKTSLLKKLKPQTSEYDHDWFFIKQMVDAGAKYAKGNNPPTYKVMGLGELRETEID